MSQRNEACIHPTALVEPGVELGKGVVIGPYCIVGNGVVLEDHVHLHSHVVVHGDTRIGPRTQVWPFATIGSRPQDLKFAGEKTRVEIGSDNMIREYVNISLGTEGGGSLTKIGSHNLLMVYVHVAHDVIMGDHCIIANSVQLAGHVTIEDRAVIGGASAVHQFCKIGRLSMTGGGSIVVQDVPPYCMVQGNHARIHGLNLTGLKRANILGDDLRRIKNFYRIIYRDNLSLEEAITRMETTMEDSPERHQFVGFLRGSQRGICR
jgi:UDP-N-acetylglucosamine acyltransferase